MILGPGIPRSVICSVSRSTSSRSPSHSWTTSADERCHPALARAIIALAETLGLRTIAEGIEVQEQWQALRGLGCEMGQGYFFARPVSAAAMEQKIAAGQPLQDAAH